MKTPGKRRLKKPFRFNMKDMGFAQFEHIVNSRVGSKMGKKI